MGYISSAKAREILANKEKDAEIKVKEDAEIKEKYTFETATFYEKMEDLRKISESRIRAANPNSRVKVTIVSKKRDLDTQKEHVKSGASETSLSLHNFGAAADFKIEIDGQDQDVKGPNWYEESVPFRILGSEARAMGMFWGWPGDAGHVAETRFVHELLEKYPEQINQKFLKDWYTAQPDTVEASYKKIFSMLDSAYNQNRNRVYIGKDLTRDRLFEGIPEGSNKTIFGYINK